MIIFLLRTKTLAETRLFDLLDLVRDNLMRNASRSFLILRIYDFGFWYEIV